MVTSSKAKQSISSCPNDSSKLKLSLLTEAQPDSTFRKCPPSFRPSRPSRISNPLRPSRYDKLVIAVGSTSSTHGVPGLENCFQLKTVGDAQAIRRRIMGMRRVVRLLSRTQSIYRQLRNCKFAHYVTGGSQASTQLCRLWWRSNWCRNGCRKCA